MLRGGGGVENVWEGIGEKIEKIRDGKYRRKGKEN